MINFTTKIEQGGQSYEAGNTTWIRKFIEDIIKFTELTDSELQSYAEKIKESIKSNIFYGKSFTGGALPALAPSTIKKKGHAKPLIDTFDLYKSILKQRIPNGWEIFVGSGREQIAFWLQFGTRNMPAREFFGITLRKADEYLNEILRKRSFRRVA